MRTASRLSACLFLLCFISLAHAQGLVPRAYVIAPVQSNAITLTYMFQDGSILFDPSLPLTNAQGRLNIGTFNYYRSLDFFGRSANIVIVAPYTISHFQADILNETRETQRSGMLDSAVRFSVNLVGGPAMSLKQFAKWQQKTLLGVSMGVSFPTGQYDSTKLINPGTNRWAFKPEIGLSRRWDHWILDGYAQFGFFTKNDNYFSTGETKNTFSQQSIVGTEWHLSYDLKPGTWMSFDVNYWRGGRTSVNDVVKVNSLQSNSRVGATAALRVSTHQSVKFSYSNGAFTRIGGNFQTVSFAWQYSWLDKRRQ